MGVSLCSISMPSNFGKRAESEMISDWIFPPGDLATTTLMGGWAGFRRARVRARYELGLLQGSRTTTALSGVGPGPKDLEQECGGCWISPSPCASPLHDDWGFSWGLRSWGCTFVPVLLFPRCTIMVRHQVSTEGAGVTLPSCLHMFPSLHVDEHTCSDGGHPGADSTPSQSDRLLLWHDLPPLWSEAGSGLKSIPFLSNMHSFPGNGCLPLGREAGDAGAGAQRCWKSCPGGPGKLARAGGNFQYRLHSVPRRKQDYAYSLRTDSGFLTTLS